MLLRSAGKNVLNRQLFINRITIKGASIVRSTNRNYSTDVNGDNPWSKAGRENVMGGTGDGKTSFDLYSELNIPLNNIKSILPNGYVMESGESVVTIEKERPQILLLLGTQAFQMDGTSIQGLDKGVVEIDETCLTPLKAVHPRPEMIVIGLGAKSRILGPKTQKIFQQLGIRQHVATSEPAASSFNLLSMERGQSIGGLLLAPNV